MNYQNTKRTLMHLFLFTNSAQRELVSICAQVYATSINLSCIITLLLPLYKNTFFERKFLIPFVDNYFLKTLEVQHISKDKRPIGNLGFLNIIGFHRNLMGENAHLNERRMLDIHYIIMKFEMYDIGLPMKDETSDTIERNLFCPFSYIHGSLQA